MYVGRYVESQILGTPCDIPKDEQFTKSGSQRQAFVDADASIEKARSDAIFMSALDGRTQVRVEEDGILGIVDVINDYAVDLKTTASISELQWDDNLRMKIPFYAKNLYRIQGAIYSKLTGKPFRIAAISKEKIPEIAIIDFDPVAIDLAWDEVQFWKDRIMRIVRHEIEPVRCEKCDYCRLTKGVMMLHVGPFDILS